MSEPRNMKAVTPRCSGATMHGMQQGKPCARIGVWYESREQRFYCGQHAPSGAQPMSVAMAELQARYDALLRDAVVEETYSRGLGQMHVAPARYPDLTHVPRIRAIADEIELGMPGTPWPEELRHYCDELEGGPT